MTETYEDVAEVVGQGTSIIGNLARRREEIAASQVLPLAVPRWEDPAIIVKYRPVEHGIVSSVQDRVEKAPKKERARLEIDLNCDILIRCCLSVVAVLDGREYSLRPGDPEGSPTRFDEDLAENLGLASNGHKPTAREVVKALFITDADILAAAGALADFSGYKNQEADDGLAGES